MKNKIYIKFGFNFPINLNSLKKSFWFILKILMNHLIIFNVSVGIWKITQEKWHRFSIDQTGFCTAFDDDFNQLLKFQIKYIKNLLQFEIICTDNGQPPLSVNSSFIKLISVVSSSKVSIWLTTLPDNMTLIFVPIHSLIIPIYDENNNIDNQTTDVSIHSL
jgi:hypothetical protein